jgi:hypothetical protein
VFHSKIKSETISASSWFYYKDSGPSPRYCTVEPMFKIPLDGVQAFYTLNSEKSQKVSFVRIKQKVATVVKKNMYSL